MSNEHYSEARKYNGIQYYVWQDCTGAWCVEVGEAITRGFTSKQSVIGWVTQQIDECS